MGKKDVVHMHNGILFSRKKGRYLPICDNMDGPWAHYAKWQVRQRKTSTIWYHLYMESKKAKLIKNRE